MPRKPLLSLLFVTLLTSVASAQGVGVWQPEQGRPLVAPTPVRVAPVLPGGMAIAPTQRDRLRAQLAQRRATNLARFVAYRDAGEFPQNHVRPGMLNVFIDDEGHICAAANLMAQDGLLPLVRETAARDNFLRLVTVNDGPLYRWMLSSGFTQAEIDMIQEPYFHIDDEPEQPNFQQIEDNEVRRLQSRFREIEQTLIRNAERSLDQAVDTLMAYRLGKGIPQFAAVLAHGDSMPAVAPTPVVIHPVAPRPVVAPRPTDTPVVTPVVTRAHPVLVSNRTPVRDPLVWAPHMGTFASR